MMSPVPVAGLVRTSTVDFPGRLAAVVFMPGCNYRCWYCHNWELLDGGGARLPWAEVRAFLEKRRGQLEGVVLSGGEPTLQPGLADFARLLHDWGYAVKLDSNGSRPEMLRALLKAGLLDYVALDFKAPLLRYGEVCGLNDTQAAAAIQGLRDSIELLLDTPSSVLPLGWELRTTVLPDFDADTLRHMALEVPPVPRWTRQPWRDTDAPSASSCHIVG
jgi:pyruvate formate lyase activating enzyme